MFKENLTRTERSIICKKIQIKAKNINENIFERLLLELNIPFTYQRIISPYIVDFYIPSRGLIIEIDGEIHNKKKVEIRDSKRDEYLMSLGLNLIRYNIKFATSSPRDFLLTTLQYFPELSKSRRLLLKKRISHTNKLLGHKDFKIKEIKNYWHLEEEFKYYKRKKRRMREYNRLIKKLGKENGIRKFQWKEERFNKIFTKARTRVKDLKIITNKYGAFVY